MNIQISVEIKNPHVQLKKLQGLLNGNSDRNETVEIDYNSNIDTLHEKVKDRINDIT